MSWSGSDESGQGKGRILPAQLAWYVTGRFYVADDGSILDAGYFLHLQDVTGALFLGAPGEGTACFTFLSEPFRADRLTNGDLSLAVDTVGEFSLYLNREPGGPTFDDPQSFGAGERIAAFRRTSIVVGSTVGGVNGEPAVVSVNLFSAALVWSKEFEHAGRALNLSRLLPNGITQWGTASTKSISPLPAGYTAVVPFVGSAIAIGN